MAVSAWLAEFNTWVDGLLGSKLDAALVKVRAAVQRGDVGTEVQPQVQAFANTLDALRSETVAWLEKAGPLMKDNPDLEDRGRRMVFAYNTLHRQWTDKAATERISGDDQFVKFRDHTDVGLALTTVVLLTVAVGATAYAVTEVGAAWAIAAKGDTEAALAQVRLQEQDLAARVDASKDGRTLPPATVAPPSPNTRSGDGTVSPLVGAAVAMGALLVVGGGIAFALTGRR